MILTFTRCSILRLVLLTYAAAKVACAGHEAKSLVRELRGLLEQARQEAESAKRQLADATQGKEAAETKVKAVLGLWSYFLPAARHFTAGGLRNDAPLNLGGQITGLLILVNVHILLPCLTCARRRT